MTLSALHRPFMRMRRWQVVAAVMSLVLTLSVCMAPVRAAVMSEQQKIDALLNDVEAHRELKFIRLGSIHSSREAAQMLRTKLRFAGGRVKTADQFIEYIASATQSGHTYFVLYPDGRRVPSGQFLRGELKRIISAPIATSAKRLRYSVKPGTNTAAR